MAIVEGRILCCVCREWKPLNEYPASRVKDGNGRCRSCSRRVAPGGKAWRATASPAEIERIRARSNTYYMKDRANRLAGAKARALAVNYGMTPADYTAVLAAQGGRCACCGSRAPGGHGRFHVDHDHQTGVVRGLLCSKCNLGIGSLGDTIEGLRSAVAYLERAARNPPLRPGVPSMRINLLQGD
jgi:hypothetical protein